MKLSIMKMQKSKILTSQSSEMSLQSLYRLVIVATNFCVVKVKHSLPFTLCFYFFLCTNCTNLFFCTVCFKIFDMDRDNALNPQELQHMIDVLLFIAKENKHESQKQDDYEIQEYKKLLGELNGRLTEDGSLSQEEFLMWSVDDNPLVAPMLEILFQVCHVSLGLKPHCRHHEHEIGTVLHDWVTNR